MIMGSSSGWLMLAGMMARPLATSSRTNSGVMVEGMAAPKDWPGCCCANAVPSNSSRRWFSRMAMNSISGVTMPCRA